MKVKLSYLDNHAQYTCTSFCSVYPRLNSMVHQGSSVTKMIMAVESTADTIDVGESQSCKPWLRNLKQKDPQDPVMFSLTAPSLSIFYRSTDPVRTVS